MEPLELARLTAAHLCGNLYVLSHQGVEHGEYMVVQALHNASTCKVSHDDGICRLLELMREEGPIAGNETFKHYIDYLLGICGDPMCANYDTPIGEMMIVIAFLFSTVRAHDGITQTNVTVLKIEYSQCGDQVVADLTHLFCKYPASSVHFQNRLPQASRLICLIVAPPPELVEICGLPRPNFVKVIDATPEARDFYLKLRFPLTLRKSALNTEKTGPDRHNYTVAAQGCSRDDKCRIVHMHPCRCKE